MSAEEHERTKVIKRKQITDELRLYNSIWKGKTTQKIVYNDQVKIGHSFITFKTMKLVKKINK